MKKTLLVIIIAIGAVHQVKPMIFKKSQNGQNIPVFQPEVNIADEKWDSDKDQYSLAYNGLDEKDRKEAITSWCNLFKGKSKRPAMWTKDAQEEKEIEKVNDCMFGENQGQDIVHNLRGEVLRLNDNVNCNLKSDFEFLHKIEDMQKNEWNTWQQDSARNNEIMGIQVTYKQPVSNKQPNLAYARLNLTQCKSIPVDCLKYFIAFDQSPYYKKGKDNKVWLANVLENSAYHNVLRSLQITKAVIERDLHNQSYFQRIWNYTQRQNSWQALARVDEEIDLFKDQDRVVSSKKVVPIGELVEMDDIRGESSNGSVISYQKRVYKDGAFTRIPQLTHRDVFTRSNMPRSMFEQVKTSRE